MRETYPSIMVLDLQLWLGMESQNPNFTPDFKNPNFKQSEIPKSQFFLLESQNPKLAYWALKITDRGF